MRRLSPKLFVFASLVVVVAACGHGEPNEVTEAPDSQVIEGSAPMTAVPSTQPVATTVQFDPGSGVAYDELPAVVEVVALGGSNVGGYGLGAPFDPEQAYPGAYARLLAEEAGVEAQLHPHHTIFETRSLSAWNELLSSDEQMRADLAAAEVVIIEVGVHTILIECGDYRSWTKDCLIDVAATMPDEYEELLSIIEELVADGTIVMMLNQGIPRPGSGYWRDHPDWPAMKAEAFEVWWGGIDTAAAAHDAIVVDTARMFGDGDPDEFGIGPEYTQPDGAHFNPEGHRLFAELLLGADGVGPDA